MTLKADKVQSILNVDAIVDFISSLQTEHGDIPWHENGKTDPWDLVETIMGLNVANRLDVSYKAFEWLKKMQNPDGSWYSSYIKQIPEDKTRETHISSYISVGLLHTRLINKDDTFLEYYWDTMGKSIDYAVSLQSETGEIYWAKSSEGKIDPMALLTGSSSVFMSLKAALTIAKILGKTKKTWEKAFYLLEKSLKHNIYNYNITKSRYSMYWFYPVLCGALTKKEAEKRISKGWNKYVIERHGARCVSDQSWVTIAETCELVLSLCALGDFKKAGIVFSWIQDRIYADKTYWCGYTYPDMVIWPEEKISWTNAVVLMAADALYDLTCAARLFSHNFWDGFIYKDFVD